MSKFVPSNQFSGLLDLYSRADDVYSGTESMRNKTTEYLPRGMAEHASNYAERLSTSVLKPIYKRTIKQGVGKAFAKGMIVNTVSPMERLIDNADGAGTSLITFSKALLDNAINYGITYLMIDYPITTPNATLADERASGAFPYFVNIKPTAVLDLRVAFVGAYVQCTYFRFLETVVEFNYLTGVEESMEQVKELYRNPEDGSINYRITRKDEDGNEFVFDENQLFNMTEIPIVPVYGNKVSSYIGTPTLIDLVEMSITHWQLYSGYLNSIKTSTIPILEVRGWNAPVDEQGKPEAFILSPNTAVQITDPQGGLKWVNSDGNGIESALKAIKDLEDSMALSGLELTVNRAQGTETATGRLIDAAEANSILTSIVMDLEWSLYKAFIIAAEMIKVDATDTEIDIDASFTVVGNTEFNHVMALYSEGLVDAKYVLEEAKTVGIFKTESILAKDIEDIMPSENTSNNTLQNDSVESV